MRRAIRPCLFLVAMFLAVGLSPLQIAHAISGRLILHLEGDIVGTVPPSVVLQGAERQESVLLGALAVSTGEIRFVDIPPGTYRIILEGAAPPDQDLPKGMEVAIAEGKTSVLRLDLNAGRFRSDPFRPDPFGVDETWDGGWLEMLPGAGNTGALASLTSPAPPRQAMIEGLDISGSGFRHRVRLSRPHTKKQPNRSSRAHRLTMPTSKRPPVSAGKPLGKGRSSAPSPQPLGNQGCSPPSGG